MKYKSGCILVVFFTGMFLLQIWVAQAEGEQVLTKFSSATVKAVLKILKNNREQIGLLSLKESQQKNKKSNSSNRNEQAKKEVVWYKPWTWFK